MRVSKRSHEQTNSIIPLCLFLAPRQSLKSVTENWVDKAVKMRADSYRISIKTDLLIKPSQNRKLVVWVIYLVKQNQINF